MGLSDGEYDLSDSDRASSLDDDGESEPGPLTATLYARFPALSLRDLDPKSDEAPLQGGAALAHLKDDSHFKDEHHAKPGLKQDSGPTVQSILCTVYGEDFMKSSTFMPELSTSPPLSPPSSSTVFFSG